MTRSTVLEWQAQIKLGTLIKFHYSSQYFRTQPVRRFFHVAQDCLNQRQTTSRCCLTIEHPSSLLGLKEVVEQEPLEATTLRNPGLHGLAVSLKSFREGVFLLLFFGIWRFQTGLTLGWIVPNCGPCGMVLFYSQPVGPKDLSLGFHITEVDKPCCSQQV